MKNKKMPLVSICCITFNQEKYIRECLEGITLQIANFNYEIVIHDDASTDKTKQIIREYESKFPDVIVPIYQSENQYSKGKGILIPFVYPRARGKYIALCEGDDYWTDPYKLQKQVDFLENNPDYSMCFHAATEIWEDYPEKNGVFSNIQNRDYVSTEIFNHWIIPTASTVFRKEVIDSKFYNENISSNTKIAFGDIALFITCSQFGKIRGFSDVMSVYRRHSQGMTQQLIHFSMLFKYCSQSFYMASIFISDKKLNKLIHDKAIKRSLAMYWTTVLCRDQEYRSKCYNLIKSNLKHRYGFMILQGPVRFYMALRTFYRNKNK